MSLTLFCFDLQVLYKEDFEKNKGKAFSAAADTPEFQRIKKTQEQISNVSVCNDVTRNAALYFTCSFISLTLEL